MNLPSLRMWLWLSNWKNKLLSSAERVTLIKSVIKVVPAYTMAAFNISISVFCEIDAIACRFW